MSFGIILVHPTGPTSAMCHCPCGCSFEVEAVAEKQLIFDEGISRLRAVCPMCGKLEAFNAADDWGGKHPHQNRIDEFI